MNEARPDEEGIFDAAQQLSDPARVSGYLDEACAGQPEMRRRIERLLGVSPQADEFFQRKAPPALEHPLPSDAGGPPPTLIAECPGDLIGRYKLLEKIGEGGCGVVYMAEQEEPVRRKVALKIIKPGMDSRQVIARFEAERQALALMDHPNIARVFDGGVIGDAIEPPIVESPVPIPVQSKIANRKSQIAQGRPYFVMELVRGVRITDYCTQKNLSIRERLDLFTQVCHAVQHAHQKGIIHRDLKPSNILVTENDGKPVPKVIDFGIAKATEQKLTDKTLFTQFAQLIGTPAYMSPEQAAMTSVDIDTRSDIYSLGVLLYELLTGTTPFDTQELLKAGFDEMRRVIRETEPERPSTRLTTVGATTRVEPPPQSQLKNQKSKIDPDLDWIVMKCLEKDRTRRYETANCLAADLQRHLSNEPVVARPPSAAYRFRKMVQRNKLAFAAAGIVTASVLSGLAVSTWLFFKERAALAHAVAQQHRAEGAERRAEEESATAREVNEFVQWDLLGMADSAGQMDQGWPAKPDLTVVEAVDRAAQRVEGRFKDQPLVEAGIRHIVGIIYTQLGEPLTSLPHLERALELRTARLGPNHPETIDSLWHLGQSYHDADRFAEAASVLEKALDRSRTARPTKDPATLKIQKALGNSYRATEQWDRAIACLEETLHAARANAVRTNLNRRKSLNMVGNTLIDLSTVYKHVGRRAEARAVCEEGVSLLKTNASPDHPNVLIGLHNLAVLDFDEGDAARAAARFEEILRVRRVQQGLEHPDTLETIRGLAFYCGRLGRTNEAEALHRESLEITRKLQARKPDRTIRSLVNLGNFHEERSRSGKAEPFYREALQITRQTQTNDTIQLESRVRDLAECLHRQGRYAEAEPLYLELLQLQNRRYSPNHDNVLGTTATLARLLTDWAWAERSVNTNTNANSNHLIAPTELSPASGDLPGPAASSNRSPWQRAVEAKRLLRGCLDLRASDRRVSRARVGDTQSRLGAAVLSVAFTAPGLSAGQRSNLLHEAETDLLAGQELMQNSRTGLLKYQRDGLVRLIRLYAAWNKPDQAAAWQQQIEALDRAAEEHRLPSAEEASP